MSTITIQITHEGCDQAHHNDLIVKGPDGNAIALMLKQIIESGLEARNWSECDCCGEHVYQEQITHVITNDADRSAYYVCDDCFDHVKPGECDGCGTATEQKALECVDPDAETLLCPYCVRDSREAAGNRV